MQLSRVVLKIASATTGPGVTTCRLVRISPRSASTTNPVAWLEEFHSVSKARVLSTRIETTPEAIFSRVSVHAVFSLASAKLDSGSRRTISKPCLFVEPTNF